VHTETEYDSLWLQSIAPYVGKSNVGPSRIVAGQAHLLSGLTVEAHKSKAARWGAEKVIPSWQASELMECKDEQIRFLEAMAKDGVAMIYNLESPEQLDLDNIGAPLEKLVNKAVGQLYTPPRRKTKYGMMRKKGSAGLASDYNFNKQLTMHTDHAFYWSVPGYFQYNWQVQGSVQSKVCNGITVAEHLREADPEAFELLSTVHVTHALRTNHYSFDGSYKAPESKLHDGTFENMHTHPIIELDADGNITKISHNELKRGIAAVSFDQWEKFHAAYSKFSQLCEDPKNTLVFDWPERACIVINNHFVMHGRATQPPDTERIFVWAYTMKEHAEDRYRLLQQWKLEEEQGLNDDWSRPVPNQVLLNMQAQAS